MNTIDILIEGYAKITKSGWDASGTTTLITASHVIASESRFNRGNREDAKQSSSNKKIAASTLSPRNDVLKIIVDPGANRDLLFSALKKRNLSLEDIDMVFITHHHLDHAMNVGLFPNAKVIDEEAVYQQAMAVEGVELLPDTDITVVSTPGHEYAHACLVIPTENGTVIAAGDCFWWADKEKQVVDVEKHDDFAENMKELIMSRKEVLRLADWIIPGHGKMFKNER